MNALAESRRDFAPLNVICSDRPGLVSLIAALIACNSGSIVSLAEDVRRFRIPCFRLPSQGPGKSAAEARVLNFLDGEVDLLVFVRYMQIRSEGSIDEVGVPIINIRNSFQPALIGAAPNRKVK